MAADKFPYLLFPLILVFAIKVQGQQFIEVAEEINIGHVTYSPNYMAGGVSIFDFNNDGLQDIYLTGGAYPDHLYKNIGNGNFMDVTEASGISQLADRYTMGVVSGDLDNDGYTDLFITTYKGEQNICLRNNLGETFTDVTLEAGFFGEKWSASVAMGDPDNDGDLDIYVTNFLDFTEPPFFRNISAPQANFYFENLGNFKFQGSSEIFEQAKPGCSLAASFTDVDRDGDVDLFVINDFGYRYAPNELFINEGGLFLEMSEVLGVNAAMDGMGISTGDLDENGQFDYYFSNVGDNQLYVNLLNETDKYAVNDGGKFYSWGTFFADLNHDSYLDLFVAKGSISESDDIRENKLYEFYPYTSNFVDVSALKNLNAPEKARGAAFGDLDNDGDLDLVVNNVRVREENKGTAAVFFNNSTSGDFLQLKLEGQASNRSAYGAIVELFSGERKLIREVQGGSSYLSNNSSVVHFGLANLLIDSLMVVWPSGLKQTFSHPLSNFIYRLKEGGDLEVEQNLSTSIDEGLPKLASHLYPNPAQNFIVYKSAQNLRLQIMDVSGKAVPLASISWSKTEYTINISSLESGIYFLFASSKEGRWVQKFVVAR